MKRVAEVKITIENCNNISKGVISLEEEKLNIRYGMNGTGKSTLSTAISLFSQGKPMDDLKPFGSDDEIIPAISIDGDIQGVRVFNEDFVNNMVFKESTVIDNAFDVFIRTTDYVLVKFINESYHIENDYAYYLDMVKFETVPEYIVKAIDDYMERTYSNV